MANIKKTVKKIIPQYIICNYCYKKISKKSKKTYLEVEKELNNYFKKHLGHTIDWDNPVTFNEKIQVAKLYDATPIKTKLSDKVLVRDWVRERVPERSLGLIPVLAIYDNIDKIDFSTLPKEYVIKMNNDCGSVFVCDDQHPINKSIIAKYKRLYQKRNFAFCNYEMQYKRITPKVIVEKNMGHNMRDYKFFCFGGKPEVMYLSEGLENHSTARISFFDMDFKLSPYQRRDYKQFDYMPEKPKNFDKMRRLAGILSKGFDQVRVDFYEIDGKVYFGEMTFTTAGGFIPFTTKDADKQLGSLWHFDIERIRARRKKLIESNARVCD